MKKRQRIFTAMRWFALPFSIGIFVIAHYMIIGFLWFVHFLGLEELEIKDVGSDTVIIIIALAARVLFFELTDLIQPYPTFEKSFFFKIILGCSVIIIIIVLFLHKFSAQFLFEMLGYAVGAWVVYKE